MIENVTLEELEKEFVRLDREQSEAHKEYLDKWDAFVKIRDKYEKVKYKDKTCDTCRYYAVLDFSGDGWHNLCGNDDAPSCTCCHSRCDQYKPDNVITKWCKDNLKYKLSKEDVEAIKLLYMDIMAIDVTDYSTCKPGFIQTCDKIIETLKIKRGVETYE